ncbi:MAG: hypothetical protein M3R40_04675, partial [Pseudomonadota bacterium]|nr:hypothetical protein [Pseudomonadota bacterium]
ADCIPMSTTNTCLHIDARRTTHLIDSQSLHTQKRTIAPGNFRLNGLELMLNGGQMGLRICSNSCCALLDRQLLGDVPLCHSSARPVFRGRRGGILEVQVTVSAPAAPCERVD